MGRKQTPKGSNTIEAVDGGHESGHTAVVVVHGVGSPSPGETLECLIQGITLAPESSDERPFELLNRGIVYGSVKRPTDSHLADPFPIHQASAVGAGGKQYSLFEVFWGNGGSRGSGLAGQTLGAILGVLRLVLRMHLLIRAFKLKPDDGEKPNQLLDIVKFCALSASWMVRGPILAFNFVLLFVYLTWLAAGFHSPLALSLIGGLLVAFLVVVWAYRLHERPRLFMEPWIFGCVVLAGPVLWATLLVFPQWSLAIPEHWTAALTVLIGGAALLAWLCVSLVLLFGGVALVRASMFRSHRPERSIFVVVVSATLIQVLSWMIFVIAAWRIILYSTTWLLPTELGTAAEKAYDGMVSSGVLSAASSWILLAGPCAFAVWRVIRVFVKRDDSTAARSSAKQWEAPRVILHPFLFAVLVAATICMIFGVAGHGYSYIFSQRWISPDTLPEHWRFFWEWSSQRGSATAVLGFALVLVPAFFRQGAVVVADVVDYVAEIESSHGRVDRHNMVDRRIRERLNDVMRRVLDAKPTRIVLVTHSLGSVVVLDYLRQSSSRLDDYRAGETKTPSDDRSTPKEPVLLITMGSPASHLFQEYFPTHYPAWTNSTWDPLRRRVHRWINICRNDDYIGTTLTFNGGTPLAAGSFREEFVGKGGHTQYWLDARALRHITPLIKGAPADDCESSTAKKSSSTTKSSNG